PVKLNDDSWITFLHRVGKEWKSGRRNDEVHVLRKQPSLQGPIDDAFMDSFIFVQPTGRPMHEAVGKWSDAELERAIEHWRRQFRGEARVKKDSEIASADML